MRTRNRTDRGLFNFRSAGVSPASESAGETPALRFARRAIPWLAVLGMALACCPWAFAEDKPPKPTVVPVEVRVHSDQATVNTGKMTATITATKNDSGKKDAKGGDRAVIITTLTLSGNVMGQFPETLDQALTAAMEGNPKVVAAKAKLTLAESELNNTRMEVARKVVAMWAQRQQSQLEYDTMLQANKTSPGSVPNASIINSAAIVSHFEMELRSLIGQAPSALPRGAVNAPAPFRQPPKRPQLPRGPVVEKIRKAMLTQAALDFTEVPLSDVVNYLKYVHGIEIQIDKQALDETLQISFSLKGVPLGAALQAFDDQFENIKLVVRDYGILVTTPSRAVEQGYLPVVDFARLVAEGNEPSPVNLVPLVPQEDRSIETPQPTPMRPTIRKIRETEEQGPALNNLAPRPATFRKIRETEQQGPVLNNLVPTPAVREAPRDAKPSLGADPETPLK
jgi:hypothetical protein